jgi:hypothetical protein
VVAVRIYVEGGGLVGKISLQAIRTRCPRFGKRFLDHMAKLARPGTSVRRRD